MDRNNSQLNHMLVFNRYIFNIVTTHWTCYFVSETSNARLGIRVSAVVRAFASPQCEPGSILELDVISGMSLLLVLVPSLRDFLQTCQFFLPPQKQYSKF